MSYTYEPEIEEEDAGYSIPKILVAVLLLIVIGAGAYIYYQQKKISNSIAYLINAKKQVEQDLNKMIEKYNLAIEDNDFLADELRAERDRIIRFRDSIKNVKGEDFTKISQYEKQIKNLKDNSAIVFDKSTPITTPPPDIDQSVTLPDTEEEAVQEEVAAEPKKEEKKAPVSKEKPKKTTPVKVQTESSNDVASDVVSTEETVVPTETTTETVAETPAEKVPEPKKEEPVKTTPSKQTNYTNFTHVETPPTYPGCKGNATAKKACFTKKVKTFVSRKFDASVIDGFNVKSGKKRIWVSFYVDKFGNITGVTAVPPRNMSKNAASVLKKEAEKVIKKLPKMTAARQNGNPVTIKYAVPITFIAP